MEILAVVASCGALFLAGANVAVFCIIKFNDLAHMQKGIEDIKADMSKIWTKVDSTAERTATIEGKICLLEKDK